VYQVKQTPSIIIILQRSLCLQGKQQLFSQQLYKLLKGDDFQIRNSIIITIIRTTTSTITTDIK